MKHLLSLLLLLSTLSAWGQSPDSTCTSPSLMQKDPGMSSLASGALLTTGGTLFTYNPYLKSQAVSLRDAVQADGHDRLLFDNYLQYLPAVTPAVLNLCGVKGKNSFWKMAMLEGGSYLLGAAVLNAGKYGLGVLRPDGSAYNSFPSGHTFTAFTGAEILRREYGEEYPWIGIAGYAVATLVGAMRIYNNRHWAGDVLAGAGLGILSVTTVYWLFDN